MKRQNITQELLKAKGFRKYRQIEQVAVGVRVGINYYEHPDQPLYVLFVLRTPASGSHWMLAKREDFLMTALTTGRHIETQKPIEYFQIKNLDSFFT